MKRFLPVIAAIALLAAFAMPAGAAPKSSAVQPRVIECSGVSTLATNGWLTYGVDGIKVRIQRQYTPGGSNCNAWRSVTDFYNFGTVNRQYTVNTALYLSGYGTLGASSTFCAQWLAPGAPAVSCYGQWIDVTQYQTGCVWRGAGQENSTPWVYTAYVCV